MARSKAYALKALELDKDLSEAHAALALVKLLYEWDWSGATEEVRKALDLKPAHLMAHAAAALRHALIGKPQDAVFEAERAKSIDPLSARGHNRLGWYYEFAGEIERAIEQWETALELDPNYNQPYRNLALHHCRRGAPQKGIRLLKKARTLAPDNPLIMGELGYCYGRSGERDKALKVLREIDEESESSYVSPIVFALIHVGLGAEDEALSSLEKAYELRAVGLVYAVRTNPEYEPLHSHPRFTALLRRMGLEE